MSVLVTLIHIVVCIILIMAILLQSGKAADLAGAFGGGGSQTMFGTRGAGTLLSKVTTICAILFMFTSLGLWVLSGKGGKSVVSGEAPAKAVATETKKEQTPAPALPQGQTQPSQAEQKSPASVPEKK